MGDAMRLLAWLAVPLLAALALSGCGDDAAVVPEQDGDGRYVIHLLPDNRFSPDDARVPEGATVVWVVDGGHHDVNAEDDTFSSNRGRPLDDRGYPTLLGPGEEFEHTFNATGTWRYWCHTHHEMDMMGMLRVG